MDEKKFVEDLKREVLYEPDLDDEEEEDDEDYTCDITGEECIGDPAFCEECPIMTEEDTEVENN